LREAILKSSRSTLVLLVIAAVTLLVDQFTKYLAVTYLAPIVVWAPVPSLANFFTFTYTTNTGVAFGLFKDLGPIFVGVAVVVIAAIVFYQREVPQEAWPVRLALGLQLGGAAGNLLDRLRVGHVIDFIHFHFWPVFNVADSSIVIGVILLAFIMLREGKEPTRSTSQQTGSTDPNPPTSV
jgi:signal peptidase II